MFVQNHKKILKINKNIRKSWKNIIIQTEIEQEAQQNSRKNKNSKWLIHTKFFFEHEIRPQNNNRNLYNSKN